MAMTELSPQAQALVKAATSQVCAEWIAACVLRALVTQEAENITTNEDGKFGVVRMDRILALITELESAT